MTHGPTPQTAEKDLLFILTEHRRFCILEYDANSSMTHSLIPACAADLLNSAHHLCSHHRYLLPHTRGTIAS